MKMRLNIVALYQGAFYCREDDNKDRKCIVTPFSFHFHNNTGFMAPWGKESGKRDLQMFYLCADFSVLKEDGFSVVKKQKTF